ncbi:kinase-like protein, partial [Suillus brevipes Sb2]
ERLFREIRLGLKLEHEHIIPLWGVTDGFGSVPGFVSPWFENDTLTRYLDRIHEMLSYSEKFALLRDVARGLQYLHSQSIVHGDLAGHTVLVDRNGKASLTNFGLSDVLLEITLWIVDPMNFMIMNDALLLTNPASAAPYMAPESLTIDFEDNSSPVLTTASDVYSFGGIMLQVLEGMVPYHDLPSYEIVISFISQGIHPRRQPTSVISDIEWEFIQRCWLKDMDRRPLDSEILPFVEGRA